MPNQRQSVGEKLAGMATTYFISGAMLVIWSGLWLIYLWNHQPRGDGAYYFAGGLLLTGLTLILGAALSGPLGRAARQADMSPDRTSTPAPTPENPNPVADSEGVIVGGTPTYTTATTETR